LIKFVHVFLLGKKSERNGTETVVNADSPRPKVKREAIIVIKLFDMPVTKVAILHKAAPKPKIFERAVESPNQPKIGAVNMYGIIKAVANNPA
jgi:hypothetical protein